MNDIVISPEYNALLFGYFFPDKLRYCFFNINVFT